MALRAVEMMARAPLTDIRSRLRLLADELPDEVTSILVLTYPDRRVMQFGEMETVAQSCGMLALALHDLASMKSDG